MRFTAENGPGQGGAAHFATEAKGALGLNHASTGSNEQHTVDKRRASSVQLI